MSDSRGPEPPEGPPEFGEDPERAGDELSAVVFDEHFVRSATFHEPSAAERLLAAAPPTPPPTPAPPAPAVEIGDDPVPLHEPRTEGGFRPAGTPIGPFGDPDDLGGPIRSTWWRQSVAWVLALLMGIGVVAMAITAVTPGRTGQNPTGPQPTVGTPVPKPEERTSGTAPSVSPAAAAKECDGPLRTC